MHMATHLVRRDPYDVFSPFFAFSRRFNDLLTENTEENGSRMLVPAMDVAETEDGLTISVELPGLERKDVKLRIENGVLTLSGEKASQKEEKKRDFHCVERRYGTFRRQISLPSQVDAGKANASFENGVLTIEIPKLEAAKPRELEID